MTLNSCLKQYYNTNYLYILTLFSSIYIFKQMFCIPGSLILVSTIKIILYSYYSFIVSKMYDFQNVMAGSLFGSSIGLLLVCTLSSLGVAACYLLSKICGIESLIVNYFPSRLAAYKISLENLVSETYSTLLLLYDCYYVRVLW